MKKAAFVIIAIVLAAVVAVAGCIGTPADEKNVQSPFGEWMNNGENYLSINPDGTINVIAGNIYMGTWEDTENGMKFTLTGNTMMVETEEEKAFIEALTSVTGAKFENGNLVLTADGNDVLEFKRVIVGTWENEDVTLTIMQDKTVSATAGVNIIFGTCQFTENGGFVFSMQEAGSTLALGSDEDMAKEAALIDTLGKTADYTIINGKLTLIDADGKELLVLTATPVGSWTAEAVALELAEDGTAIFLFEEGNIYKAVYEITENKVVVKDITQTTRMMQTDAEKAFFETFESAGNTLEVGQFLTAHSLISADEAGKVVLYFKHA